MPRICIIGAGISGLVAARTLQEKGFKVSVVEKSRSFSGRCATRFWNGHIIDHGVQYFTADESVFMEEVEKVVGNGLARVGSDIVNGQGIPLNPEKSRYYLKEGNNRIGKYLASGVKVIQETPVQSVSSNSWGTWVEGESFRSEFDAVVICAPLPQALTLLGQESKDAGYEPCLTAFFEYDVKWAGHSSKQYAVIQPDSFPHLAWSACENHKEGRISGDRTVMVVQASVPFSRQYLEAVPSEYLPILRKDLEVLWELPVGAFHDQFAHRWRYARRNMSAPSTPVRLPPGVFLCGDSRVRSRLESVWLDGKKVADEVKAFLS